VPNGKTSVVETNCSPFKCKGAGGQYTRVCLRDMQHIREDKIISSIGSDGHASYTGALDNRVITERYFHSFMLCIGSEIFNVGGEVLLCPTVHHPSDWLLSVSTHCIQRDLRCVKHLLYFSGTIYDSVHIPGL